MVSCSFCSCSIHTYIRTCTALMHVTLCLQRTVEQYRAPFEGEFKGQNDVGVYELSLVDKLFYRIMRRWIERNLRKSVPSERQVI